MISQEKNQGISQGISQKNRITLGAVAEINLNGVSVPLLLLIDSEYRVFLILGSRTFEFSSSSEGFKASYRSTNGDRLDIREILQELTPDLARELPGDFSVNLQQVTIAYQKLGNAKSQSALPSVEQPQDCSPPDSSPQDSAALLLSARLGFDINLADLPLVGDKIPEGIGFRLKSFQIAYASQSLNKAAAQPFNQDLNLNLAQITDDEQIVLSSGLNLSAELQIGDQIQLLSLPLTAPPANPSNALKQSSQTVEAQGAIEPSKKSTSLTTNFSAEQIELWLELNKTLGPIALQKIGVQYRLKESELWFFLNASLSFCGLTLACNNLGVGSSLSEFKPKFRLDGISIHYRGSDAVQIGGAFLRKTRTLPDGKTYEEYSGAAIIGTKIKSKKITLTAIGSYTEIDGQASLFVFALLDYPLGGPPAFFVTGLAAGFGYNRSLKVPETVEAVARFPLVRLAMGEPPSSGPSSGQSSSKAGELDLLSVLDDLGPYIPPARDEMFFAIGVKFTSFKLVDAFVLLIVKLGKKLEIHVLGLAVLTAPPMIEGVSDDIEPVAQARLALRVVFIPDDGVLKVEAVLAEGSYIFSRNCYLSGGFAFYTWFSGDHEGDFVLTLGGYHPEFKIPDHYPRVPRVQLSWRLNEYFSIKGYAYFALTPSALMVGGGLEASYQRGNVYAYFKIEAHFLVAWQPFFYSADVSVEIRASAKVDLWLTTTTLSVNVRASLSIWGPPFAGRAQFEIAKIKIEIGFGDGNHPRPKALSWSEFQKSLLPNKEEVCSIAIADGLLSKVEKDKQEIWIVNAKELVLVAESAIPGTAVEIAEIQENAIANLAQRNQKIGIRPMGVRAEEFEAVYRVSVSRNGTPANQEFSFLPVYKNVPSALWKSSDGPIPYLPPGEDEDKLLKQALSGFEIRPAKSVEPGKSEAIDAKELLADRFDGSKYTWSEIVASQTNGKSDVVLDGLVIEGTIEKLMQSLQDKPNHQRRQNLLDSLSLSSSGQEITLNEAFTKNLPAEPILVF